MMRRMYVFLVNLFVTVALGQNQLAEGAQPLVMTTQGILLCVLVGSN